MVNKSVRKKDSESLLSGKPVYMEDMIFHKDVLTLKALRSPYAFAKIRNIDVETAKKVPEVVDIYTYKDVPYNRFTECCESYTEASPYDRCLLEPLLRYVGDEVAIVAAETEEAAEKALKLIKVDYEVLEPILDPRIAEGHSSIIHPEEDIFCSFPYGHNHLKNIVSEFNYGKGDVDEEFKNCDVIIERTYKTQAQSHCMLETHRAYTYIDANGRIVIISPTQTPYHMRRQVCRAIGIPASKVRLIKPRVGGGFGGKKIALVEPFAAFVTWKTGRPCKFIYTRNETFTSTNTRHPIIFDVKIGADKEGNIKAIEVNSLNNAGAHGGDSVIITMEAAQNSLPTYNKVPAIKYTGKTVYTNLQPGGALRGYGATQGTFALDSAINELSVALDMDPVEVKLKNTIRAGEVGGIVHNTIRSFNIERCIERGKELIGWDEKYPRKEVGYNKVRGIGMALGTHVSGVAGIDKSGVSIRLVEDGTYMMLTSSGDTGTGSDTILSQIAAEALNTSVDNIQILAGDTDACPYDTGAFASSTTYVSGNAVIRAAKEMETLVLKSAEKKLNIPAATLELKEDRVCLRGNEDVFVTLQTLAEDSQAGPDYPILIASASSGITESPRPIMAGFAEVEVDKITGEVKLVDYVAVIDCGTVINPNLAKIQAEGGLTQGIGMAMFEEVIHSDTGKLMTNNFMNYNVPNRKDIGNITVEFQPQYEPTGPFGAKSLGEIVTHTPSPAIASAIYNAVGVQIRDLPITPEKVYKAMKEKELNNVVNKAI
ncbi:molybdopterin-dependent oxidoreductase [Tissierella pigra]|uniref:xanthine dehydrogenase family protein molybdopterin-binding subunit n=1 Tax=Tissierella pigra TaxID=2607614 RepID=UPI001C127452|nr:molybdopterin cofactor-binding domain-containing protein [Tissierella pigra]MBU5425196.1 molybdopterin-dependent oxidoreductase [Tissierella pigra]